MIYRLFFDHPHQQKIRIELDVPASGDDPVQIIQSRWRPGRYELADYAEHISDVRARTSSGRILSVTKSHYHIWEVEPTGGESAIFEYQYYANARDAGGSWFDDEQVYINGVNLFMYFPGEIDSPSEVTLNIPKEYQIACGLRHEGNRLFAANYHELVDAPLIASATLQHHIYMHGEIPFHLWFQGNITPDWQKLEADFSRFTQAQIELFGNFPVKEYHFLFQIHNRDFYHGVEHFNSTIIALGPGYKVFEPDLYVELLGVSCHELFHTWNVKAIRPADMRPYRYDEENFSRLHYVTEGVTTYYGDLMLMKSGVWTLDEYLQVVNTSLLARYYQNNGRQHISLEEASFDSWVNGYKATIPNRRISFYTKGALAAFVADVKILQATGNTASLDTVMREMWNRFGKTETGYTRDDYQQILESVSGVSFESYFEDFISGTTPMETAIGEAANYLGLSFEKVAFPDFSGHYYGFLTDKKEDKRIVKQVFESSPADRASLRKGDEIIALNGLRAFAHNFGFLVKEYLSADALDLHVFRDDRVLTIAIPRETSYAQPFFKMEASPNPSPQQLAAITAWANIQSAT